jgi:hypothetical protein
LLSRGSLASLVIVCSCTCPGLSIAVFLRSHDAMAHSKTAGECCLESCIRLSVWVNVTVFLCNCPLPMRSLVIKRDTPNATYPWGSSGSRLFRLPAFAASSACIYYKVQGLP